MFFSQEDYRKIETYLLSKSIKDTELEPSYVLDGTEEIAIIQDGLNVRMLLSEFLKQLPEVELLNFLNINSTYKDLAYTLLEAVKMIPVKDRKQGLVITFRNAFSGWELLLFRGDVSQWENIVNWHSILENKKVDASGLPDEEFLTLTKPDSEGRKLLTLKDKVYNTNTFSGTGNKIVRKNIVQGKNILTQEMVNTPNTNYEILYDFDLNNTKITLQEGSSLEFKGGSIKNGTLDLNNNVIKASPSSHIFKENTTINNANQDAYVEWFGVKASTTPTKVNSSILILNALNSSFRNIYFNSGYYYIDTTLNITSCKSLILKGHTELPIRGEVRNVTHVGTNSTVLWTDLDIDVITLNLNDNDCNYMSIEGGNIDVSSMLTYSKSVIKIAKPSQGNYNLYLSTHIEGSDNNFEAAVNSCNGKGIVFEDTLDATGTFLDVKIDSHISRLHTAVTINNPIKALTINGTIACKYAINFGTKGCPDATILGYIITKKYHAPDNTEKLLTGNLKDINILADFVGLGEEPRHTKYAFDINKDLIPLVSGATKKVLPFINNAYLLFLTSEFIYTVKTLDELKAIQFPSTLEGLQCIVKDARNFRVLYYNGTKWLDAVGRDPYTSLSTEFPTLDASIKNNNGSVLFLDLPALARKKPLFYYNGKWVDANGYKWLSDNFGTTAKRPSLSINDLGFVFYDTTLNKLIVWNGINWVDFDGKNPDRLLNRGTSTLRPSANVPIGFTYKDTTLNKLLLWDGDKWVVTESDGNSGTPTGNIIKVTLLEYDALPSKDSNKLYVIIG